MKKIILFFTLSLLCDFCLFAQNKENKAKEKSNFNGTWILDEDESFSDKSEKENYENYLLTIFLAGNELKINKNYNFKKENTNYNLVLFVDNRGEKKLIPFSKDEIVEVNSKTSWHKNSIVRKSSYKSSSNNKSSNKVIEKFRLSKDGNKLIASLAHFFESYSMQSVFSLPVLGNVRYELTFHRKN